MLIEWRSFVDKINCGAGLAKRAVGGKTFRCFFAELARLPNLFLGGLVLLTYVGNCATSARGLKVGEFRGQLHDHFHSLDDIKQVSLVVPAMANLSPAELFLSPSL